MTVEVPAPASGILAEIAAESGDTVAVGALLGAIGDGGGAVKPAKRKAPAKAKASAAPDAPPVPTEPKKLEREPSPREEVGVNEMPPSPAARKLLVESDLGPNMSRARAGAGKFSNLTWSRRRNRFSRVSGRPRPRPHPALPSLPTTLRARSGCA